MKVNLWSDLNSFEAVNNFESKHLSNAIHNLFEDIKAQKQRIAELESQNQGISVEDKLPATYGSYDSYGNDLTVSDPVVTNKGLACYCSEHDNYGGSVWIGVDWDHKEAGRKLEGVTYWLREAVLDLRNQAKTLKEQGE